MKHILIILLTTFTLIPFSGRDTRDCNLYTLNDNYSVFYFNRCTEKGITKLENGTITIYGNLIRVDRTVEKESFTVTETNYNDEDEVYTFNTDKGIIVFDVSNRTFSVNDVTYHINSTIKSNW